MSCLDAIGQHFRREGVTSYTRGHTSDTKNIHINQRGYTSYTSYTKKYMVRASVASLGGRARINRRGFLMPEKCVDRVLIGAVDDVRIQGKTEIRLWDCKNPAGGPCK